MLACGSAGRLGGRGGHRTARRGGARGGGYGEGVGAERTRQRILEAATEEFAAHGLAGARVDRIAARSGMSKPMLYSHFGAKERLFDAVFDAHVLANAQRVPFTAADPADYARRLYDDYLADPALMRLVMWKRLEQEPDGYLYAGNEGIDEANLADIAEQQRAGLLRPDLDPADLWTLLIATAAAWAQGSVTTVADPGDPDPVHQRRRAALGQVVDAALRLR